MITDEVYEQILTIMDNMVTVMELSPRAFLTMGEEDLRSHFLVQLNGQYEGGATGETFNYEGKTDVLIRVEGKNVFIAECLIWDGPASLTGKLDQLLNYTSWRDTKCAMLVFSRNRDFTAVINKVAPTLTVHSHVLGEIDIEGETRFWFQVRHRDDPDRSLALTVLLYNVPSQEAD